MLNYQLQIVGDEFVTSIGHDDQFYMNLLFDRSIYRPMCTHMGKDTWHVIVPDSLSVSFSTTTTTQKPQNWTFLNVYSSRAIYDKILSPTPIRQILV